MGILFREYFLEKIGSLFHTAESSWKGSYIIHYYEDCRGRLLHLTGAPKPGSRGSGALAPHFLKKLCAPQLLPERIPDSSDQAPTL